MLGIDIVTVKEILGHQSVNMTLRYFILKNLNYITSSINGEYVIVFFELTPVLLTIKLIKITLYNSQI